MTFDYLFGGLSIRSTLSIDGLRENPSAVGQPDILLTAEISAPPVPERDHYRWPGRYGLRLGTYRGQWLMQSSFDGSFLIARDGRSIHVVCEALPPGPALVDVLVRRVLPRVATLSGATAIHAAALAGQDGGLLLLGPSGAGKSTLSAALAHFLGWEILSDDISILREKDEVPMLAAAATGVCVWPQSREGLGLPPGDCFAMPGYDGKLRYDPRRERMTGAVPLRGFVFLDRSADCAEPQVDRLSLATGVAQVVPQIIRFNPEGASSAERIAGLVALTGAMRTAPVWRLSYPASYAALPAVAATLGALARTPL